MKKFLSFILVAFMLLNFAGCKNKANNSNYDDGLEEELGVSEEQQEERLPGDPYGAEEIGQDRAYQTIIIFLGEYDSHYKKYAKYEYEKDSTHNGKPCYMYSRSFSDTATGTYTKFDYVAVYKDGSGMELTK